MKNILGLDLGTNSIGWALIQSDFNNKKGNILGSGVRVIPMSQDVLGKFDSGVSVSQTAERTQYRGMRRLNERNLLRRERLLRVLHVLNWLPTHYDMAIDFEQRLGQFKNHNEPKLSWEDKGGHHEFIFMKSFNEMLNDFKAHQPSLVANGKKIPHDWTIYYLRKKALTQAISKHELAWILLNFNQKRGYYQLRGEEEETDPNKQKEFITLKVKEVIDSGEQLKGKILYNVVFNNGWPYDKQITKPEDWLGQTKEFIVTKTIKKDGEEKLSFKLVDSEQDWIAIKEKTQKEIALSNNTVGTYIYDNILSSPSKKIRGGLIRTIERKFYKDELQQILLKQAEFHSEFKNRAILQECVEELYPFNEAHKQEVLKQDLIHLLKDDIIFYQRPLRSKKSLISDCPFEYRMAVIENRKEKVPIKCIPKSHPLFQEFRLWQFIYYMRLYEREATIEDRIVIDHDITSQLLSNEHDVIQLFQFLDNKKEITQKALLKYFGLSETTHRWNYVEDKVYPANETKGAFLSKTSKMKSIPKDFFNKENTYALWHILYSIADKQELQKALTKFADKNELDKAFVETFIKFPPYKKDYGAYSAKAIKHLLPLLRIGEYWNWDDIDDKTKDRIDKIITGEFDEKIRDRVREKAINLNNKHDFKGLPLWLASYIVYDRHAEATELNKWETPEDLKYFLKNHFQQHSLRNPIVEQVITETLRVVADIWQLFGDSQANFFDEIHIELGRELKNPATKRKKINERNVENQNTNQRIKMLLEELQKEGIKEVRSYSPSQQELLKIYEEGVKENIVEIPDPIQKILKAPQPSKSDISKYKLWLDQGYISPYTGVPIQLTELFTTKYQIEHIIPQSRYFDDSLSNKVICESEVNTLKANKTAYEFIKENSGRKVELDGGRPARNLLSLEAYEQHVSSFFRKNQVKKKLLLSEDIPDSFIQRQLNDSRYISKYVRTLLSNIVREHDEQEAVSKHIVTMPGAITSELKNQWGLNDIWNKLITPRFERLNRITNSQDYGYWDNKEGKKVFQISIPKEIQKGFSKKRIDHRHHALDAIVIASITRDHINYITSLNTKKDNYALVKKLITVENKQISRRKFDGSTELLEKTVYGAYHKPWESFTQDVNKQMRQLIVSFKQNLRVINKASNKYQKWVKKDGQLKKELVAQTKGDHWAIRKPLHKDTVYGKITLKVMKDKPVTLPKALDTWQNIVEKQVRNEIKKKVRFYKNDIKGLKAYFKNHPIILDGSKVEKVHLYENIEATANRVTLDTSFTEKKIRTITDTGIQKILINHLNRAEYQNKLNEKGKSIPPNELAFSEVGMQVMNKRLENHKPIYKVRTYEAGSQFQVSETGNKSKKYVETAKGTNLYFAVYENADKQRKYFTIPLNEVIERQKTGLETNAPTNYFDESKKQEYNLKFTISPNDLVYVPTEEEKVAGQLHELNVNAIYKMVKTSGTECYFTPFTIAKLIKDYDAKSGYGELGSQNKLQTTLDKIKIADNCWKLHINRLGHLEKIIK